MSTIPVPNPQPTVAQLAQFLTNAWTLAYNGINSANIALYLQGVAVAQEKGFPYPTPPTITTVNGSLVGLLEAQEAANPGSTTAAQWAAVLVQSPYPAVTPPVEAQYTIGNQISPGVFQLTALGQAPQGKLITVNGVNYTINWGGLFGPLEAVQVS